MDQTDGIGKVRGRERGLSLGQLARERFAGPLPTQPRHGSTNVP
jgi:hypothetical protein